MDTTTNIEEMIRQITTIPDDLDARACFGTPVERNGRTIIPVSRIAFGFGLGFGRGAGSDGSDSMEAGGGGEGEGGGGGGGGGAHPVAVIEITDNGVEVQPISDNTRIVLANTTFAAWAIFWVMWTVRTVARERAKTRRIELERTSG